MSYLVMVRRDWTALATPLGLLQFPPCLGDAFCPVFETLAEARAYHPESDIIEVTVKPIQAVLKGGKEQQHGQISQETGDH